MPKIAVKDVRPTIDGEHQLDLSSIKKSELHTIKQLSGVRAFELADALATGDVAAYCALAVVALERKGVRFDGGQQGLWELLMDTRDDQIVFDFDEEPAEDPTQQTPSSPPESGGKNEPSSEPTRTVGGNGGESQASHLSPIGSRSSATGSDFDPPTSAT